MSPTSSNAQFLREVSIIIVDECSMIPVHAIRAIDAMLRDITGLKLPFGGKVMLLGGDFRQVLPVLPRQSKAAIIEIIIKRSPLWPHFRTLKLTRNMRAMADEQEFAQWLLTIGDNSAPPVDIPNAPPLAVIIPASLIVKDVVEAIYCDMTLDVSTRAILTPRNDDSLRISLKVLEKLPGNVTEYVSADSIISEDAEAQSYPVEFVHSITPSGMPEHRLRLKPGCLIMLLRNIDLQNGLCNGTRLRVHTLHRNIIDASILAGAHAGKRVLIPRTLLTPSDTNLPFQMRRQQFPVRLAYAITINKAQGQTFDKVGLYLPSPVFAHGQLYVALSRAKRFADISVEIVQRLTQGKFANKHITQNVVYSEVL